MRESGRMMSDMEKALKGIKTTINMKGNFKMEKLMVKGFILGSMEKYMMANGKMESKMDMVFGKEFLGILILESGRTARLMVMEFINGKMEISMKESGRIV